MHRLEIKNFGPISEANIEVGDLTVIIGEQATGKSTIAKLIYFFQSLKEDALKAASRSLDSDEFAGGIFKREIEQKLLLFFKSSYFQPNTQIKYFFAENNWFEIFVDNKKIILDPNPKLKANKWSLINIALDDISKMFKEIAYKAANNRRQILIKLDSIFPESLGGLYIPAGRNLSVGYSEQFEEYFRDRLILGLNISSGSFQTDKNKSKLPTVDMFLLEKFMNRVSGIKDEFRAAGGGFLDLLQATTDRNAYITMDAIYKRVVRILRGIYRADGSGERIQFKKNTSIWLNEASSGQQESIRIMQDMLLLTREGDSVFRAIEEPEAHLFPLAQQHLVELIALAQVATNSRFVLTTHSPYIVSALNNILFYSQLTQNGVQSDLPKVNPENLRGYMLTSDTETGTFKCESLLKDVGRKGQPLKLMGHTSLDTVAEQMGATFGELRGRYRNQNLKQTPTEV